MYIIQSPCLFAFPHPILLTGVPSHPTEFGPYRQVEQFSGTLFFSYTIIVYSLQSFHASTSHCAAQTRVQANANTSKLVTVSIG